MKKAEAVSLKEFVKWIDKNINRTWNHGPKLRDFGKRTLEVKYFYPSIDTRDMKVFYINTSGWGDINVSHSEEFDGTILELLEKKLDERKAKNKESLKE